MMNNNNGTNRNFASVSELLRHVQGNSQLNFNSMPQSFGLLQSNNNLSQTNMAMRNINNVGNSNSNINIDNGNDNDLNMSNSNNGGRHSNHNNNNNKNNNNEDDDDDSDTNNEEDSTIDSRHGWVEKCRLFLQTSEPVNIIARAQACQDTIREQTQLVNDILGITSSIREFDYHTDPQVHLQFLQNWTGLNLSQAKNAPTTYKDYKSKSKNWMHGRRAPNYAKTLFPEMINAAESYAGALAKAVFTDDKEKMNYYRLVLIFSYLEGLCSKKVPFGEQVKKSSLFCKNSIKKTTKLSQLLRGYAHNHPYMESFPACLQMAVDHFNTQKRERLRHFIRTYIDPNGNIDDDALKAATDADDNNQGGAPKKRGGNGGNGNGRSRGNGGSRGGGGGGSSGSKRSGKKGSSRSNKSNNCNSNNNESNTMNETEQKSNDSNDENSNRNHEEKKKKKKKKNDRESNNWNDSNKHSHSSSNSSNSSNDGSSNSGDLPPSLMHGALSSEEDSLDVGIRSQSSQSSDTHCPSTSSGNTPQSYSTVLFNGNNNNNNNNNGASIGTNIGTNIGATIANLQNHSLFTNGIDAHNLKDHTICANGYGVSRGGIHYGSSSECRNNPIGNYSSLSAPRSPFEQHSNMKLNLSTLSSYHYGSQSYILTKKENDNINKNSSGNDNGNEQLQQLHQLQKLQQERERERQQQHTQQQRQSLLHSQAFPLKMGQHLPPLPMLPEHSFNNHIPTSLSSHDSVISCKIENGVSSNGNIRHSNNNNNNNNNNGNYYNFDSHSPNFGDFNVNMNMSSLRNNGSSNSNLFIASVPLNVQQPTQSGQNQERHNEQSSYEGLQRELQLQQQYHEQQQHQQQQQHILSMAQFCQ